MKVESMREFGGQSERQGRITRARGELAARVYVYEKKNFTSV